MRVLNKGQSQYSENMRFKVRLEGRERHSQVGPGKHSFGKKDQSYQLSWGEITSELFKYQQARAFPSGPVVKTSPSNTGNTGLIPGQEAKIPFTSWPKNKT